MLVFFHIFPWHRPPNHTDCALERNTNIDTVCFYMSLFWEGSPLNQTCDPDWERFGNNQNLRLNFGVVGALDV